MGKMSDVPLARDAPVSALLINRWISASPRGHEPGRAPAPEGLKRSRRANWKHGYYSREAKAERSRVVVLRYLRYS
jgi:hypothetical protein